MADQIAFLPERVLTLAAMPGAGYRVQFYQSGTTTPVTTYTSPDLSTAHPSILACDAAGVFPMVFSSGGAIKAVVTKPDGSSYYTVDPVFRVPTAASGASQITFAPTVELPFENVQEAIEGAAASAASGFTPFGLGVTGTNALLSNIDATATGSGSYRFDATSTGTFPAGVAASDTGTLQLWRENAGDAVQWLQSGAADRQFTRRMASSTWGAWREAITVNQGAAEGDMVYRTATAWTRLAKGTAGQVLAMNAGATAPEWVADRLPAAAYTNESASWYDTRVTFAHGLGRKPRVVQWSLECTTANNGYAVGDRLTWGAGQSHGTSQNYSATYANATEVSAYTSDPTGRNKSTNAGFQLTSSANWKLVVEVW
jgi:hypothetical protein